MFTTIILGEFMIEGNGFLREPGNEPITRFTILTKAVRENIVFPEPGPNFQLEKKAYIAKYGPRSLKDFEERLGELIANFMESNKMVTSRAIIRRIWILKQMYELFDVSMGLLIAGKSNLLVHAVTKALEVLRDPTLEQMMDDRLVPETTKNIIAQCLKVIEVVYTKSAEIMTNDIKLLKLLPTTTLLTLTGYASQKMVSKFRRLPWIDPTLVDKAKPKFNGHWQKLWSGFFARNFNLDHDTCFVIAEFMPMSFRREPFLDFFSRKYNAQTHEFFGERVFDVEQIDDIVKVTLM